MSQTQELPGEFSKYEEEEEEDISKPVGFIVMGGINFEVKRGCNKIGRDSQTCSIIINSKTVSKVHSVIECEGRDDIFIYDNGSTNKTFLGKKPLKPHCRYKLENGNSLTFGDVSVTFFLIKGDSKSTNLVKNLVSENNQLPSDDVHGIETQLNNIPSNIFDAETQLDISPDKNVARKNNKTLLQIPRIKMIPQPSTSRHQTFFNSKTITTETLPGKFSSTLIASPSKHHKKIPVIGKSFKNHLTSNSSRIHPQVYVVDEIVNPDIFSMETQCHMNSTLGLKSDLKSTNLIEKEKAHFVWNKPEIITSTPTDMKKFIPESENCLEKSPDISNNKQSQSSEKAIPVEVINNQNEELIINDEKLIQSFEDNFFLEDHGGIKNNVESLHRSHQIQCVNNNMVAQCEKNQENQNSDFKMNEEPKTVCNIADSGLPSGQGMKASLKLHSNIALTTDNLPILKESSCFDGAVNISKNSNASPEKKKSLTNNCKETLSPRSQKLIGDKNDEPNESSQSFLEITLEEDFKEPMSSPVPGLLVKKLNVEMAIANNDLNSSSDSVKMKSKNNTNEMTDSTEPFKVNKISSDRSLFKIDNCKIPSSQLSNQAHASQFNATSSLFFCSSSPDSSQDFIDTKHFHSQRLKEDFADNSEIAGTILYQDSPKIKSTPASPTKDCGSCVPESSDEDSTLSDLEIIEDSPYFKRTRPVYQPSLVRAVNDPFKQKQKFSSLRDNYVINPIKPCVKVEPKNDDDDDASDSSYVFDVVNDSEKVRLKNSSPRNNLYIMSSSDSDTSDIIGVTPPGNRFTTIKPNSLRFPSVMESIQKTVNNQSKDSPARQSDTESSDSYGFHSVKIPSPRSLEASLLRIMHKRNEAKADAENDALKAGTSLGIVQSAQYPSVSDKSSELRRKHEGSEMGNFENSTGKRNRVLDNVGGPAPPKKSRTEDAFEIDLNFWNVDADSESESPEPKLCKTQKQDQCRTDIIGHAEVSSNKDKQISSGKNHCSLDEKLQQCISLFTRSKSKLRKQNHSVRYEDMKSGIGAASGKNVTNADMKNILGTNQLADGKRKKICRRSLKFPDVPLKEKKTCNFPTKLNEDANNACYFGASGVAVAFTGLDSERLEQIIEDLGGTKTEDLNRSQVLVTDQVRRTVKFLCAIGLSKPIASPEWLLASKERGNFLNPWDFILKCDESEEKWKFDLSSTLEKSKKKKLLEGFQVFATQNVRPPVCDILYIVECCGGIPLREKPETWTKHTIVLSCLEDKKWWPPWKFRSVKIVHYEFILSGVLQQKLDFKTYKLR